MSVRSVLIVLNFLVVAAIGGYVVLSLRRSPETKDPENLTPFLPDEDLEDRRLSRVLGWALLFAAVLAVALPAYWLREPDRQDESISYFDDGAVERGSVLFAGPGSEAFNSVQSLQCANCHGADGSGGAAPYVYTPPGGTDTDAIRITWSAPALNTVLLRFSEDEVREIITYGRPGTPMQAWGVAGGGPKNEQSINDLVAYLRTIQLTPDEAQAQARTQLSDARKAGRAQVAAAEQALADTIDAFEAADQKREEVRADGEATAKQLADADKAVAEADTAVNTARRALAWAQDWAARRTDVPDGQLLFELYCARCHTQGWSIFDPTRPNASQMLGLAGGGGTVGFNLRDGQSVRRFGTGDDGFTAQTEFVGGGSEKNKPYGIGGIGNGRMPGFAQMLPPEYIDEIVAYERSERGYESTGLDATTYTDDGE